MLPCRSRSSFGTAFVCLIRCRQCTFEALTVVGGALCQLEVIGTQKCLGSLPFVWHAQRAGAALWRVKLCMPCAAVRFEACKPQAPLHNPRAQAAALAAAHMAALAAAKRWQHSRWPRWYVHVVWVARHRGWGCFGVVRG